MFRNLGEIDRACIDYSRSGELGNQLAYSSIRAHCI